MRRLAYLLLLVLVVGASARCVNASTDCERWFAAYHSELAHSQQLQRIAAAKRRAKAYARRKLAGYVKPPAKPKPHLVHTAPMNRRQSLRHLDLACGVLPETDMEQPLIAEETPGDLPPEAPLDEVAALPGFDGPGTLLPEDTPPPPAFSQAPPFAPPGGGGPPIFTPPFTTPPGGGGSTPPNGGPPSSPPGAPPSAVPEPGSFVLLLTGCAGATGIIRRRYKL
jgi:hypothetical protein